MGISRWTQDLTPYLEAGVVTTTPECESRLILRNVVVDGPSLVFHVYNALVLSNYSIATGSLNEPTYIQLNSAIVVFLTDLESCGAKIDRIFFDGALPLSKRSTRIDRLEKSRKQLERLKVVGPPPRPLTLPEDTDKDQLSNLLWQTKPSSSGSSSLVGPFIVPTAIEHLTHSKWKDLVSVVNGEAEIFCASLAMKTGATVLSNDSDLTLSADMQDGQSVGLLRSMSMHKPPGGAPPTISIQCWRPKNIATRLGVQSLLHVGFERSKDSTASFATVLQRSQNERSQDKTASGDFDRFADQFTACVESKATIETNHRLELSRMDPRVAELVCQLMEASTSSAASQNELWVTLPILLEDPSKDASWAYGRELRRLGYSLLCSNSSRNSKSTHTIMESIRKGPRIAQDLVDTHRPGELRDAIRSCTADIASLPQSTGSSPNLGDKNSRDYVLWALGSVLKQRTVAGKNAIPSKTIQEYLGQNENLGSRSFLANKRAQAPDYEAEWRLVHLNANVHSVLYSLRILGQICVLLRDKIMTMDYKVEFVKLLEVLRSMPAVQDLFLDVGSIRSLMQQSPLSKSDRAFDEIHPYSGHTMFVPSSSKIDTKTAPTLAVSKNVRKRNKKRRLADNDYDDQCKQSKSQSLSTNPFDILAGRS